MKHWNCLIVDDEDIDRLMTLSFAKKFPQLNIISTCASAEEAISILDKTSLDILFLDIDMPGLSGVELRKKAMEVPVCIFITGHPEYAVESFELETLDFIVKPLRYERFEKAMQRVDQFLEIKEKASLFELSIGDDVIYIKEGNEKSKIKLFDILYLEALKDYTLLVTEQKKHCIWSNIGSLLKQDPFQSFTRIHRSFAIQKQFVKKISAQEIMLSNNALIPVGRSYKESVKMLL
ncbi:response regulator transcription factor [Flavobacterium sp. IMCC34852]|uniref:Response regulator transcription factor n=1 Tax=Flavobacterium rivulicola TaxID=2732161 RepID=A0A7Y3R733_9FLAO|nr:LytTR family DNA-binding domain-containing protein [Flavobacterium sp. IMCC34852]NNT70735.1 response regulator transcription factor [Flavobacterium sp. IMCC34852]